MKSFKEVILEAKQTIYDNTNKYRIGSAFWQAEVVKYLYRFLLVYGTKKRSEKVYPTDHSQYTYKLPDGSVLKLIKDPEYLEYLKNENPEARNIVPALFGTDNKGLPVYDLEMTELEDLYTKIKNIETSL